MMNKQRIETGLYLIVLTAWYTGVVRADDAPPHKGPPPEAIEACSGLEERDACTIELDDRTRDGICRSGPDGASQLACAPARSGHPPARRPPEEAIDACDGLDEGDACTVSFGEQTLEGTCRTVPGDDDLLACLPDRAPGPPPNRQE